MSTAGVVGLFDRDVFIKLGCCDLWGETLAATGVTRPYRLPSCTVSSSTRLLRRSLQDPSVLQGATTRLQAMVASVPVLDESVEATAKAAPGFTDLANTDDIDVGEAVLVVALEALADPDLVLTGDKRFVASLRRNFPQRFALLARRILSFEACLTMVCRTHGVAHVVDRVRPVAGCDGTLRLALGPSAGQDHRYFLEALASCDPCRI